MCKKSLLMMLLLALLVPWAAKAQTTVTIGEGTATNNSNPIGTYYNYSITEQLYTAEEIGTAGTISSISFYYMGIAAKDLPITVYMANVDAEDLTSGISLADADEVFSGTLPVTTTAGWVTINLATPFDYDGTSNLLIGFIKDYLYYFSGQSWQGTATTTAMARYTQSDSAGPYTTSTVPGTTQTTRPNIQMVITPSSGPVCEKPETFEVSNVTTNSATLTWTGGSGTYNVEYKGGTVADWTAYLTNTTSTSANLTGLTPGTAYQYRVQSVCSDGTSGWKSVGFSTMYGIPLVEGFGTAIPSGWSIYSGLVETVLAGGDLTIASYGWSFGSNNGVFDNHARVNIYGTSCNYWLVLPTLAMENNVQLMFDVAYTAYSGTGAPALTGEDDKFVVLVNNGSTWEIVRQWDNAGSEYVLNDLNTTPITVAIDLSNYAEAGQPITLAFYGESTESNADNNLHIDNVSVDYIPACAKPIGLAVNYEGGTEATISWTSDATAWNMRVNGVDVNGVITNPYTLTGLELSTTYEVEVQANCGADGESEWVGPVSFTTDDCMPEDQIVVNYELTDSYGDGWNGNAILVVDENCNIVNQLTIESGNSASGTLRVCGSYVQFLWYAGSYPGETSWVFKDNAGNVLFEGAGTADMATLDVLYTIDNNPYSAPTDVAASEVGPRSAKLSWTETGTATAWQIKLTAGDDEEGTIIDANSNPFVITGLTPETEYFAQVRATGANGTSIWTCIGADFTTDVACPKPSNLSVTAYPFTADVTWNGFADAYDLEWALVPASESKDALWLQYDNGTYDGGIGNSTANTWTWGVMYPASMLAGNGLLSKVSIYENSTYNTADITINVYTGGDTAPETLVYTETITPEAGDAFHEINLAEPVTIDPTQNLWITLTEYGTYVLSYCQNGDNANNDWVLNGSTWAHIGDLAASLAGDTWMIRGYVEPAYDPSALVWNPVSGVTSPYTIEGLQPETTYVVRVKAVCGGDDGESGWTMISFTTPSACDAPSDLEANDITYDAATLGWIGYQESYNLRYRHTDADPTAPAIIILEAHDTWEDSTGYQMLLDADATAFGVEIPESGPYTGTDYSAFEYLIPENADCDSYTENLVFDGSVTIEIPAGVYDWCIVNPEPGGNMWIAGNGDIPGRYDDYVFEAGVTYHFTMQRFGTGDGAALEITRPLTNWTDVDNITNPYELTGLNSNTYYEWQVQGINRECDGGLTEWSEVSTFTTEPTQVVNLKAGWNWFSTYVENDDPIALLQELQAALGENGVSIESIVDGITEYLGGEEGWLGDLDYVGITNDQMYLINVTTDCTISLNGAVVNPAEVEVTIYPQDWNWISYPCTEEMTLEEAFVNFEPEEGDRIECFGDILDYAEFWGEWIGFEDKQTLKPGEGYLYYSQSGDAKTLIFPMPTAKAKAAKPIVKPVAKPNLDLKTRKAEAKTKTIDFNID